jgi:alpha-1,6-rhamnosyltransferase
MKENGSISPSPRVTVIVPVYNSPKLLAVCLDNLLPQDYPDYEVIVVDDGSTDDTVAVAKRYPVKVIESAYLGLSSVRNQGIRAARGEIVMTVDADLTVPHDLIRRMAPPLADPAVGVTMAWWGIRNPENLVSALIYRVYEYFVRNLTEADFFWGYCVAFKKTLVEEAGYFDETLSYVEDVDFAYRVARAGRRIKILKDVRVWHYFRDSLSAHLKRHYKTARHKFLYVCRSKKYTDQRASPAEYGKLILHLGALFSLALLPLFPLVTGVLFASALLSHLPLTVWGMKQGFKYILLMPFEFLTKMAWALGVIQGVWWLAKRYNPMPKDIK